MTDEKRKEYHDAIIIHLAKSENRDETFVFDKLYEDLQLPPDYIVLVFGKCLAHSFKGPLTDMLNQLKNTQSPIRIRKEGLEYAEKLDADIYKKTGKSILHPPPLANSFEGQHNEREIILHAIKYLQRRDAEDNVQTMFPNIRSEEKISYIESILITNELFTNTKKGYYYNIELKPSTRKRITEIGPEKLVDDYFFEMDMISQEKSATRNKLWYETSEAERRFNDYGRIVKNEKWLLIATIVSAIVSLIALIVSLW